MAELQDTLLYADMRRCVREHFGSFITSIDKRFAAYEANDEAFDSAKAELREQIARLYAGLAKLDECDSLERADKIKQRMVAICKNEVAAAFAKTVETFMNGVLEYAEL